MTDKFAATAHAQIRSLLIDALEQFSTPGRNAPHDPRAEILASERLIAQAAAIATGYRALAATPGSF